MPIINGVSFQKKEKIKAEVNAETLTQIEAYCKWAKIDDIGFFIEEAASFIFAKDRDWKLHAKATKRAKRRAKAEAVA